MKPIAIFFHCLFYLDGELLPQAVEIVRDQMDALKTTGLLGACSHFEVGINGGTESLEVSRLVLPPKATVALHGLDVRNECVTIRQIERWMPSHPDWNVLYFHSKGATKPPGDSFTGRWRSCMMRHNVFNWRQCVSDLDAGHDAVGVHWMCPPATPPGQHIFAGSFWWAKSNYLATLPSIMKRDRIKVSGLGALESRYEAEVWIGNGPRLPRVKDYHPNWNPSKIATCV